MSHTVYPLPVVLGVIVFGVLSHVTPAYTIHPSVVAFTIPKEGSHSQSVELETATGLVTCRFEYTTGKVKAPTPTPTPKLAPQTPEKLSTDEFWQRMSGKCLDHNINNWKYKICIGKSVDQDTGETYNLGKYAETQRNKQLFRNGHTCGDVPRSSTVEFICSEGTAPEKVKSIDETSRCVYSIIVASDMACKAGFPKTASQPAAAAIPQAVSLGNLQEAWFLEIVEELAGDVRCSAQNAGQEAARGKSSLPFTQVSLALSAGVHGVSCLRNGRVSCAPNEFEIKQSNKGLKAAQSTAAFTGELEYIEVST